MVVEGGKANDSEMTWTICKTVVKETGWIISFMTEHRTIALDARKQDTRSKRAHKMRRTLAVGGEVEVVLVRFEEVELDRPLILIT